MEDVIVHLFSCGISMLFNISQNCCFRCRTSKLDWEVKVTRVIWLENSKKVEKTIFWSFVRFWILIYICLCQTFYFCFIAHNHLIYLVYVLHTFPLGVSIKLVDIYLSWISPISASYIIQIDNSCISHYGLITCCLNVFHIMLLNRTWKSIKT